MTREVPAADVFAAVVPEHIDPGDPEQEAALIKELDALAFSYVIKQWVGTRNSPQTISNMTSEWMITTNPDDVAKFQPAHDCAACRSGNDQAMAYLRDNPGRWVALANLNYIEVWES